MGNALFPVSFSWVGGGTQAPSHVPYCLALPPHLRALHPPVTADLHQRTSTARFRTEPSSCLGAVRVLGWVWAQGYPRLLAPTSCALARFCAIGWAPPPVGCGLSATWSAGEGSPACSVLLLTPTAFTQRHYNSPTSHSSLKVPAPPSAFPKSRPYPASRSVEQICRCAPASGSPNPSYQF